MKLGLSSTVPEEENTQPFGCNFTVSVDARKGLTTGISAADRATTVRVLGNPRAASYNLVRPGQVFPVRARRRRAGPGRTHTEKLVDRVASAQLPTEYSTFVAYVYSSPVRCCCKIFHAGRTVATTE